MTLMVFVTTPNCPFSQDSSSADARDCSSPEADEKWSTFAGFAPATFDH
jgi:hypothetical protein